jgi:hypothetical protein
LASVIGSYLAGSDGTDCSARACRVVIGGSEPLGAGVGAGLLVGVGVGVGAGVGAGVGVGEVAAVVEKTKEREIRLTP